MNHPALTAIAAARAAVDEVRASDPTYLTMAERKRALVELATLRAQVDALQLAVLAASGDIVIESGDRSTAHWLARESRESIGSTRIAERVAVAVDERWTRVGAAMREGRVNLAQARV